MVRPKSDNARKNVLHIRVSDKELEVLKQASSSQHLSLMSWVRKTMLEIAFLHRHQDKHNEGGV